MGAWSGVVGTDQATCGVWKSKIGVNPSGLGQRQSVRLSFGNGS